MSEDCTLPALLAKLEDCLEALDRYPQTLVAAAHLNAAIDELSRHVLTSDEPDTVNT